MTTDRIKEQVNLLCVKDTVVGCGAMKTLQEASNDSDFIYTYIDYFADMMENDNSYIRTRGLLLIAANAKWDADNKINKFIDEYLNHIMDKKPITSRQCIQALPTLAIHKPELKNTIIEALLKADVAKYADSMQGLVAKDIQEVLDEIRKED